MNLKRLAAIAFATFGLVLATAGPADAIIGGQEARTRYPFMVSIQEPGGAHFCGGSLITPQWVVTAAHCALYAQQFPLDQLRVRVGSLDRTSGGRRTGAAALVPHPDFVTDPILVNDIALVKLDRPVPLPPVSVAWAPPPAGTRVRTLGWGCVHPHTSEHPCEQASYPTHLRELDVRVTPDAPCAPAGITHGLDVCTAGIVPGTQICGGDSGGPLLWRGRLIGIASRATGTADQPPCSTGLVVYTNATAYRSWLASVIS